MGEHRPVASFRHSQHAPPPLNIYVSVSISCIPAFSSAGLSHQSSLVITYLLQSVQLLTENLLLINICNMLLNTQNFQEQRNKLILEKNWNKLFVCTIIYTYTYTNIYTQYDCALLWICWQFKNNTVKRSQLKHCPTYTIYTASLYFDR